MPDYLIRLQNISKAYQRLRLNIKQLDISAGQCLIITGDNGSGKTTLLKIISGLISADSGSIEFNQQSFAAKKNHPLKKHSVYIASKPYLFDCSVAANLAYPLLLKNQFNHQKKVNAMLNWANLTPLSKQHALTLSSGEQQKLALARAYLINPTIWLLDEPTDNLDKTGHQQVCLLLNKLLKEKHSIIIVTHNQSAFKTIAHQTITLP